MNQNPQASAANTGGVFTALGRFFCRYPVWLGAGTALLYFAVFLAMPHGDNPNDFHYRDFGRLPVMDQGRCKPLDTAARMDLMIITSRQQFYDPETKTTYPATKWFLDSSTIPAGGSKILQSLFAESDMSSMKYKVFRIENDRVLAMFGLKMRDGLRYSAAEFWRGIPDLMHEAEILAGDEDRNVPGKDPKSFDAPNAKIMELAQHVRLYLNISSHAAPLLIPNPDKSDRWSSIGECVREIEQTGQVGANVDMTCLETYLKLLAFYSPGPNPNLSEAEQQRDLADRQRKFNGLLTAHLVYMNQNYPNWMRKMDAEVAFNEFAPFYRCLEIYIGIALFAALSWVAVGSRWAAPIRRAALAAMIVTFAIHVSGLIMRMYLQDRYFVFVTNLYSSAIFIGWGCVGGLPDRRMRSTATASPLVVGSVTGFLTLIIAHILSLEGDTMEMMQAVLDTNFWLATHVTCVTLGYTTAFVAGFMGIAYIILGIFTDKLRDGAAANLTRMTYGVLCTGMFLSFVGTVLGGLWADYSWGRFWGWDPKENGALLIVIWIALILHARWGGMVKQRGIAVLAVLGIIVTGWSWFGTNFLGIGLHAYGGAKGSAMLGMVLIDFLFLGIAGLGLLPLEQWQSFRPLSKVGTPLPPAQATGIKPMPG